MVRSFLFIVIFSALQVHLFAQQKLTVEIGAWMNVRIRNPHTGFDPGTNGAALGIGMNRSLGRKYALQGSCEIGAAGTGNYTAFSGGISRHVSLGHLAKYSFGVNTLHGIRLSRPDPLYMFGFEQQNTIDFLLRGKPGPGIVLALRYYSYPGYDLYSEVYAFLDLRLGLRYVFN